MTEGGYGDPIRVLHLNPAFKLDGPGRAALAVIRHLPRNRVEPEACSLSSAAPEMETRLHDCGIRHTSLGARGLSDLRALPRLVRLLRRRRIQVLHTHLTRADWIGRTAARIARTPIVVSTIQNLNREVYRAESGRIAEFLAPRLDRLSGRWADALVAVSADVEARLINDGFPRGKVHCIPNTIELDSLRSLERDAALKPQLLNVPESATVIGTVALLKEQKGHRFLIEAAARIVPDHPQVRFALIGAGPTCAAIRSQIDECGLGSAFVWVGFVENVVPYLKAIDIFVLPSLWEGMPLALLEAMAAGIPCVGTNVSGIREVIQDDVTGVLVPPADSVALAAGIGRMLAAPGRAARVAEAGRKLVHAKHDPSASAFRHAELYGTLLARYGKTGR